MTRVLNLSYDDYANFAYDNSKALISVGIDAVSLKRIKHPFGYAEESRVAMKDDIIKHIKRADIIQLFHTDSTWLDFAYELGKRIVVYHTGTGYQQNPDHCNKIFNDKVERCFTDQCEFIGLGMKNETYIATAVDTNKFRPDKRWILPPYHIAHYPSNPVVKGSEKIAEMISKLKNPYEYLYSDTKVNHREQMDRMSRCDIYIELFNLKQHDKDYGCFGVTAFEAAALGKIVFTNNIRPDVYESVYGPSPFWIANTEDHFIKTLDFMLAQDKYVIANYGKEARHIMEQNHSYEATGNYLKKCLAL
jgi:hypothetical protein